MLTWLMVAVSAVSLGLQGVAALHLWRRRAGSRPELIAGRGYTRTAASRVAVACLYLTVAAFQVGGIRVPGSGGLSPESVVVFSGVQLVWIANSAADVRARRRLSEGERSGAR